MFNLASATGSSFLQEDLQRETGRQGEKDRASASVLALFTCSLFPLLLLTVLLPFFLPLLLLLSLRSPSPCTGEEAECTSVQVLLLKRASRDIYSAARSSALPVAVAATAAAIVGRASEGETRGRVRGEGGGTARASHSRNAPTSSSSLSLSCPRMCACVCMRERLARRRLCSLSSLTKHTRAYNARSAQPNNDNFLCCSCVVALCSFDKFLSFLKQQQQRRR